MPTALGDKIRTLRKEKGYTLEKLGEITDSSKSYIWELENKHPPRPSAEKVSRIAAALGVTTDYLVDETEASPDEDTLDEAFFRKYKRMPDETKKRLRQILDAWDKQG